MAADEQQFAYSPHRGSIRCPDFAFDRAAVTARLQCVGQIHVPPSRQYINTGKSTGKASTARITVFALFMLLMLLCSRQVFACCDGNTEDLRSEKADSAAGTVRIRAAVNVALAPEPGTATHAAQNEIKSEASSTLAAIEKNDFVKISASGEALPDNEARWDCIEDQGNNLVWEVKKNDGGIRDRDYSYSWLHNIDGKGYGVSNGGRCKGGVNCDTGSYVRAMNRQKLCGYTDWRLPTREEMETLIEYNSNPKEATINTTYFPEAIPSWYWTASENLQSESYAWYVLFRSGIALNDLKERPKHIRLVRSNQTQ